MIDRTSLFQTLHRAYVAGSGLDLPLTMPKIWAWDAWASKGFTECDLRLVISFIQRRIKENRRRSESLRFKNLIEDTERFYEDLAEARALARVKKPDCARVGVLRAMGSPAAVAPETTRTAAEVAAAIIGRAEAARKLKELRESL